MDEDLSLGFIAISLAALLIAILVFGWVVKWLWNAGVAPVFTFAEPVTYQNSVSLLLLAVLLHFLYWSLFRD